MIATPGPVMILVASAGLKGGYRKSLQTIVGTNLASLVLIAISILILKGMLSVNETLFLIIKILGCLYIAYLGYGILKEVWFQQDQPLTTVLSPVEGGLTKGFLVGISNPKDIIFFSSFFPQFIHVHSDLNVSLVILVITWIILDFLTLSIVYLSFNQLSKNRIYPKILGLCGLILVTIALYGLYISAQSLF
ncbi:amino acid transporter [Acinetobacter bereziniae]|nr:amino acid transporter [Acinetobacter bereziniae]